MKAFSKLALQRWMGIWSQRTYWYHSYCIAYLGFVGTIIDWGPLFSLSILVDISYSCAK